MLILRRKIGEKVIVAGPDGKKIAEVTVTKIHSNAVRLGIDAKGLDVMRDEKPVIKEQQHEP